MSKEEIRTKWIRHTPLMKLDECVDNAMQEYADQQTKPLIDEIEQVKSRINELEQPKQVDSECEAVEFAEWIALSKWKYNGNTKTWYNYTETIFPTTKQLYEIFKNR